MRHQSGVCDACAIARVITFLSDYGLADEFVGICHGVIARACAQARVIDLTHAVPRHDVRAGALLLRGALAYLPVGVHLAVVDPGVGSPRRALAVRAADDRLLVGPDNGLLAPAIQQAGGALEAVDLARSPVRLEPMSATFHGRDLFAPVAAHLAAGMPLADTGEPVDPGSLHRLELTQAAIDGDEVAARVLAVDHFGNLVLDLDRAQLAALGMAPGRRWEIEAAGRRWEARHAVAFSDVAPGELLAYQDAGGWLALAVNCGSARERLELGRDARVRLRAR